jgi:hypothetical protein
MASDVEKVHSQKMSQRINSALQEEAEKGPIKNHHSKTCPTIFLEEDH